MRSALIFLACLGPPACLHAERPVWPTPSTAFAEGRPYAEFLQPTASGKPESGLFGCHRTNGQRFHEAIDIAPVLPRRRGEATDPVFAAHSGIVVHVNRIAGNSSYGRYVVMEHPDLVPAIFTLYSHLATIDPEIGEGTRVPAGGRLGVMGRSAGGYSIPPSRAHLHFEVGLRLSDRFDNWYQRQKFESANHHGNYNGINLLSWDPLDYYTAFRDGETESLLGYVGGLRPAVQLHVHSTRRPDFLDRYPELVLPGCEPDGQAGWEVVLNAWGLPLSFRPLARESLVPTIRPGRISVVAVDRAALAEFACRRIVQERNGRVVLGRHGRLILEILFQP